jgi:hypothetical protein
MENTVANRMEEKRRRWGIGQRLAFSAVEVKERSGGFMWLLAFLTLNRTSTRIGRFTWVAFGLWGLAFFLAGVASPYDRDILSPVVWGLWILGYPVILLNRFDSSGPTIEEFARMREEWMRSRPKFVLGKKK